MKTIDMKHMADDCAICVILKDKSMLLSVITTDLIKKRRSPASIIQQLEHHFPEKRDKITVYMLMRHLAHASNEKSC